MLLNLTEHSKDPLHRQITIQLARHIIEGDLGAGQELPSLRTLAREQHVSKTTVERAYLELASKGLLKLRRRNSPVVADIEPGQRQAIASRIGISPNSMLDALKAFSRRLASLIDPQCICELLKESLCEYLGATGVQVAIRRGQSRRITLLPTTASGREVVPGTEDALLKHICSVESPVLMESATVGMLQSDLGEALMDRRVQVVYALKHAGEIQGLVGLGRCRDAHEYSPDDLDLFTLLSDQFATALAMARLYVDSIEKCKLEEELKTAQQIQADLLPDSLDQGDALEIAAFSSPSSAVGGDFYDYFPLDKYRTGIVVADACGKGMPAAMLISQIQAMVRSEMGNGNTLKKTLAALNRQLHRHAESGFFATLFYGIFDRRKGTLKYANAGHDFPVLVRRNGEMTLLASTGPALGVVEHLDHHAETVQVHQGDSLLLYTDGVTETTSSSGRQYGEIQLRDMLIRNRHRSPADILNFIRCDVERFAGPEPPDDDRTIVVIKVNRLMENSQYVA
jgi:serine phosphatase RsbU (regulator of sigma subunit)/DNA-binding transcriptional regulator YhcF (GntR family)